MSDFEWVLFDADGVLQQVRDGWLEYLTAAGGERGEDFVVALFAAEEASMTGDDFAAAMAIVLQDFGIEAPLAEVIAPQFWIDVDAEMVAAVADLRRHGLRCALATNQQNIRGAYMQRELGYADVFDRRFYSFELRRAKPDPAYFAAIVAELGVAAGRVLFVDDNAANVAGARSAGLVAEVFPRGGGLAALEPILARHGLTLSR